MKKNNEPEAGSKMYLKIISRMMKKMRMMKIARIIKMMRTAKIIDHILFYSICFS